MSSDFGFFGETSLDMWNTGVRRASQALNKGNVSDALWEANRVIDSYIKHRLGTEKWQKVTTIITLAAIVIAIIAWIVTDEWLAAIVVGIIGLAISGFLTLKVVDRRIAVDNEFHNSYEHLKEMIAELSKRDNAVGGV